MRTVAQKAFLVATNFQLIGFWLPISCLIQTADGDKKGLIWPSYCNSHIRPWSAHNVRSFVRSYLYYQYVFISIWCIGWHTIIARSGKEEGSLCMYDITETSFQSKNILKIVTSFIRGCAYIYIYIYLIAFHIQ